MRERRPNQKQQQNIKTESPDFKPILTPSDTQGPSSNAGTSTSSETPRAKSEPGIDVKVEVKAEVKTDVKIEIKTEVKTEPIDLQQAQPGSVQEPGNVGTPSAGLAPEARGSNSGTPVSSAVPFLYPPPSVGSVSVATPQGPPPPSSDVFPPAAGATSASSGQQPHFLSTQSRSRLHVFPTSWANSAADAVAVGRYSSVIAYHVDQPQTQAFLQQMAAAGNKGGGGPGSVGGPGTPQAVGTPQNGGGGLQQPPMCNGPMFVPNSQGSVMTPGDPHAHMGGPTSDISAMQVPSENLTPEQRRLREEKLYTLQKLNMMLQQPGSQPHQGPGGGAGGPRMMMPHGAPMMGPSPGPPMGGMMSPEMMSGGARPHMMVHQGAMMEGMRAPGPGGMGGMMGPRMEMMDPAMMQQMRPGMMPPRPGMMGGPDGVPGMGPMGPGGPGGMPRMMGPMMPGHALNPQQKEWVKLREEFYMEKRKKYMAQVGPGGQPMPGPYTSPFPPGGPMMPGQIPPDMQNQQQGPPPPYMSAVSQQQKAAFGPGGAMEMMQRTEMEMRPGSTGGGPMMPHNGQELMMQQQTQVMMMKSSQSMVGGMEKAGPPEPFMSPPSVGAVKPPPAYHEHGHTRGVKRKGEDINKTLMESLQPTPSPTQLNYMAQFEGQELTITKQVNTAYQDSPNTNGSRVPSVSGPNMPLGGSGGVPSPAVMGQANKLAHPNESPGGRASSMNNITSASLADLAKGVENLSNQMQESMMQGGPFHSLQIQSQMTAGEGGATSAADNLPTASQAQVQQQVQMSAHQGSGGQRQSASMALSQSQAQPSLSSAQFQGTNTGQQQSQPSVNNTFVNANLSIQQLNIQNVPHGMGGQNASMQVQQMNMPGMEGGGVPTSTAAGQPMGPAGHPIPQPNAPLSSQGNDMSLSMMTPEMHLQQQQAQYSAQMMGPQGPAAQAAAQAAQAAQAAAAAAAQQQAASGPRIPSFATGPNAQMQVKASAPNTIQYRPQGPPAMTSHPDPTGLDMMQRFPGPKQPSSKLQYFPQQGQPRPHMMEGGMMPGGVGVGGMPPVGGGGMMYPGMMGQPRPTVSQEDMIRQMGGGQMAPGPGPHMGGPPQMMPQQPGGYPGVGQHYGPPGAPHPDMASHPFMQNHHVAMSQHLAMGHGGVMGGGGQMVEGQPPMPGQYMPGMPQ